MTTDSDTQPDPRPLPIDAGLPSGREEWPSGVLDALGKFVQGHVVASPPFHYFADPALPVWTLTKAYTPDSKGPEIIEMPIGTGPAYGLITSQTCDIVEEDADRPVKPWVQVSPIYDLGSYLNSGWKRMLQKGDGPRYLMHLPALPDGFWVADFRIEVPVEKGWLAGREPIDGFANEEAQRRVGERIALLRSRPAFAGQFVDLIQKPLVTDLKELRRTYPEYYERMDAQVSEVAVEIDSYLEPHIVRVTLLTDTAVDEDLQDWWREWWDKAYERCEANAVALQAFTVRKTTEVTVAEYKRMTTLPLARISPD